MSLAASIVAAQVREARRTGFPGFASALAFELERGVVAFKSGPAIPLPPPTVNIDGIRPGMGGTYGCWTDTYVYRVVSVTAKTMTVVHLEPSVNVGGPWPAQRWAFKPLGANEPTFVVRKCKDGRYRRGNWKYSLPADYTDAQLGDMYYLDPSF